MIFVFLQWRQRACRERIQIDLCSSRVGSIQIMVCDLSTFSSPVFGMHELSVCLLDHEFHLQSLSERYASGIYEASCQVAVSGKLSYRRLIIIKVANAQENWWICHLWMTRNFCCRIADPCKSAGRSRCLAGERLMENLRTLTRFVHSEFLNLIKQCCWSMHEAQQRCFQVFISHEQAALLKHALNIPKAFLKVFWAQICRQKIRLGSGLMPSPYLAHWCVI